MLNKTSSAFSKLNGIGKLIAAAVGGIVGYFAYYMLDSVIELETSTVILWAITIAAAALGAYMLGPFVASLVPGTEVEAIE